MKKTKAMLSLMLAAVITAGGTMMPASDVCGARTLKAAAADDTNDDWLHCEGSRIFDMNGNEVWLTGANWFGMNCTENAPHGLYAVDLDYMLDNVSSHGINIIRFPISTELLLSWMDGDPLPVSSVTASYNPPQDVIGEDGTVTKAGTYGDTNRDLVESDGKTLKNSMDIFDVIMKKCKQYGIKALIDVHSPASHNSGHNYTLWYYQKGAEDADNMAVGHFSKKQITWDDWKDSITWLAKKYANDDTIVAYDLKNEPHGKRGYSGNECPNTIAKWDNSTDKNNWKYSAEECAKSILKVNPHALILIEGIEQSPMFDMGYDWDTPDQWISQPTDKPKWYGAWWGGNLRGVKNLPVLPNSTQIVYSPHDYGPSVYAQTWFDKNFTTDTLLDDYWRDTWAYINEDDIAPLLIGEWGGKMETQNKKWMELLRDYMINNHINHTFWCLNPNSGDTEGLLDTQFKNWDEAKYALFEKSLWQTQQSGKYIGLDHQTPLGKNGLSLNEFYASYANTEGSNLDGGTIGSHHGSHVDYTTAPDDTTTTTTTTTSTTPKTDNTFWGDADCNKQVDVLDAVLLARVAAEDTKCGITEQGKINADVTHDGTVKTNDLTKLLKFLAGLITKNDLASK